MTTKQKKAAAATSVANRDASKEAQLPLQVVIDPDDDPMREIIPDDWFFPVKKLGKREPATVWHTMRELNPVHHALFRCGKTHWPHRMGGLKPVGATFSVAEATEQRKDENSDYTELQLSRADISNRQDKYIYSPLWLYGAVVSNNLPTEY